MVSSLGMLRALSAAGLEVDVLASRENAAILREDPSKVRVVVLPARRFASLRLRRELRARKYDVVIDAIALKPTVSTRTAHLMAASGARVRIGIGGRRGDFLYTHPVVPPPGSGNHVEYLAELASAAGADRTVALDPTPLALSAIEVIEAEAWWRALGPGLRLLVNISAGSAERRWPDDAFREVLADAVRVRPSLRIAITSAPADRGAATTIAAAVGGAVVALPLRSAFALVRDADVLLTPDTSFAHVAAGFQRRAVVMIARQQLAFAPWRGIGRLLITDEPSLGALTPARVSEALTATLG